MSILGSLGITTGYRPSRFERKCYDCLLDACTKFVHDKYTVTKETFDSYITMVGRKKWKELKNEQEK